MQWHEYYILFTSLCVSVILLLSIVNQMIDSDLIFFIIIGLEIGEIISFILCIVYLFFYKDAVWFV